MINAKAPTPSCLIHRDDATYRGELYNLKLKKLNVDAVLYEMRMRKAKS